MAFHVGQKVVCVDDTDQGDMPTVRDIIADQIYTIKWVGMDGDPSNKNPYRRTARLCVRLYEVERSFFHPEDNDLPFRATRFRPVIERKTDISIFTEMLKPSKVEA